VTAELEDVILLCLAGAAFLSSLVFVVLYHLFTGGSWRRTPTGRNVMLLMSVIILAFGQIFAVRWFGAYPGRNFVSGVIYLLVTYAAVARTFLMIRAQRAARVLRIAPDVSGH
jgi:hypothetical protein